MSFNAETLANLRYFSESCLPESRAQMDANLRSFAAALIGFGCPPLGENDVVRSVTVPTASGPRAGIPNAASSKLASKPKQSAKPKKRSPGNFDLFPELLPACGRASPKKRQSGLSVHALGVPSLRPVVGNGGSFGDGSL